MIDVSVYRDLTSLGVLLIVDIRLDICRLRSNKRGDAAGRGT